jgi:hypothetical protein
MVGNPEIAGERADWACKFLSQKARRHPLSTLSILGYHPYANRVETVLFSSYKSMHILFNR